MVEWENRERWWLSGRIEEAVCCGGEIIQERLWLSGTSKRRICLGGRTEEGCY